MAERTVVSAVILVMTIILVVFMVEMFLPLSANMDFRDICRNYLMKMEFHSGLTSEDAIKLHQQLENKGFKDISVSAPERAKFGENMELSVYANYTISTVSGIFLRKDRDYPMVYKRGTVARKAIN